MKAFGYPQFDIQQPTQVPDHFDAAIEWRDQSRQPGLAGRSERKRQTTLLPEGGQWTFVQRTPAKSPFERLTQARKAVLGGWHAEDESLVLIADDEEGLDALLSAALAALYALPNYKRDPEPTGSVRRIALVGPLGEARLRQRCAEAEGNALARFLSTLPANKLSSWGYRDRVEEMAETEGWEFRVYSYRELEQMGAGAFLAVARGSQSEEASIVRVQYRGNPDSKDTTALVGKGVCFDTGGYDLKVGGSMFGMNGDMGGSAVVLGNLLAATRLSLPINLTGWLALAENHIGPKAYHANQLVRALNGTTIEVVDSDAEGRMILADTLTLASREHPLAVFDYATLTGSCVGALSTRYSGVFTNQEDWIMPLIQAGQDSGERIWPFPMDEDYDEQIKSDVADIQQCHNGRSSDHIDAARFLSRFIEPGVRWVHVDLSADSHKGGLAHVPTEVTGFGVRLTQKLLASLVY